MKPKILVVDDEPDVLELIRVNLTTAGYGVVTADDGEAALKKARAGQPSLIILVKLLTMLAQRRGRVLTREQLLREVWEYETAIDSRTVDTHMRRLREKLGPAAKYLDTVRGVGYRFLEE